MEFLTFKSKIAASERERYLTDLHALRQEVNTLSEELIGTKDWKFPAYCINSKMSKCTSGTFTIHFFSVFE